MPLNGLLVDIGKIIGKFLLDIIYFPVWWYTRGLFKLLVWCQHFLGARLQGLALWVWVKNIFTPMYGQRDFASVLISFVVRVLQIIARSIAMLFWLGYILTLILLWLVVPLITIWQIIFQLSTHVS